MIPMKSAVPNPVFPRVSARAVLGETVAAPPPMPDFLYTGYTGVPAMVEIVSVLAITAAASWIGIRTALGSKGLVRAAGWVGGAGSALLGILYVGAKSGYMPDGVPAVRVTPS